MYVVLDQEHPRDLDVDGESLQVEYSWDFLLNLQEYVVGIALDGLEALFLGERVGELKFVQFQLRPQCVSIYTIFIDGSAYKYPCCDSFSTCVST